MQGALVGSIREYEPDKLETELNALIERRAANREHADEEPSEESWKTSVAEYHRDRRELLKHLWAAHYRRLARNHRALCERNEARAAELEGASS